MSLRRKQRVSLPRPNLHGLQGNGLTDLLDTYLGHILDVLQDTTVVLPSATPSKDPEDGELLFTGPTLSSLYLAISGTYHKIYPVDSSTSTIEQTIEGGDVASNFPFSAEPILYAGISLDPATANQAVIAASAGKKISLVYLETNNPDPAEHTEIYFHFSSDGSGTKLFRKLLPSPGGTVVQNFVGAQPEGAEGIGLYATTDGSATEDLFVTVGYVLL